MGMTSHMHAASGGGYHSGSSSCSSSLLLSVAVWLAGSCWLGARWSGMAPSISSPWWVCSSVRSQLICVPFRRAAKPKTCLGYLRLGVTDPVRSCVARNTTGGFCEANCAVVVEAYRRAERRSSPMGAGVNCPKWTPAWPAFTRENLHRRVHRHRALLDRHRGSYPPAADPSSVGASRSAPEVDEACRDRADRLPHRHTDIDHRPRAADERPIAEVANQLGLEHDVVYNWTERRYLPFGPIRRTPVIDTGACITWLTCVPTPPDATPGRRIDTITIGRVPRYLSLPRGLQPAGGDEPPSMGWPSCRRAGPPA
jgi:hypothetical protein